MAISEETYDKIQRYLDGELTAQERAAFEQEMETDQELALEVALHTDMEELLADSPENELRQTLHRLGDEVDGVSTSTGRSLLPKWVWLLIPLVLFAGWWLLQPPLEEAPSTEDIMEQTETTGEGTEEEATEMQQLPQEIEEEEAIPETPKKTQEKERGPRGKEKEPTSTSRPIAANFDPNPSLEFLIDNNLRSDDYEWTEIQLQKNITGTANQPFAFRFAGTLETAADLSGQEFKLHLFSNDPSAFDNFEPLSTNDLTVQKKANESYQINFQKSMTLAPGLYYYLIEDFSEEQIYLVDKFEVR